MPTMDDLETTVKKPPNPDRKRQYSEGAGTRFGSQKSLRSMRTGSISGSRGSQMNMSRKNSVTAAHGAYPTLLPEYTIHDSDDEEEEAEKDIATTAGSGDASVFPVMPKLSEEEQQRLDKLECRNYMKNLLLLCFGFFFIFTSFLSLRNLQSSLNAVKGLGMYTLSCTYAFFFVGCIFATSIVQRLGPKKAIVATTIGPLFYDFAYFYPTFYTMVPAGGLAGFCQGVIWTAHATYIANIAACYANLSGEKVQNVLSKFNGIFFVFYQCCQIVGGIIASLILKSPPAGANLYVEYNNTMVSCVSEVLFRNDTNFTTSSVPPYPYDAYPQNWTDMVNYCNATYYKSPVDCGRGYCHYKAVKSETPVDPVLVYILVGVFTGLTLTGIAILAFFLDPLDGQMKMKKAHGPLLQQLLAVFKFYADRKAICLCGIMFYSLLQAAFMFGEYNKAFVTCTIGIEYVGFIMMALSLASANAAFWNGRIQKYSGRMPLLGTAFTCQAIVFITLFLWTPSPSNIPVFFILVILWGIGDGTIMTQDISLIGFLFASNKEPAFAALKMTQSLANFTFFIAGPYMCTMHKIYFVGFVLILATTGYFSLEFIMHLERKKEAKREKQAALLDAQNNADENKNVA